MMVDDIILKETTLDKLLWKHNISEFELRQAFNNRQHCRRIEKGKVHGEHLYAAIGRTDAGRYLIVFFINEKEQESTCCDCKGYDGFGKRSYGKK